MKLLGRLYLAITGWTLLTKDIPSINRAIFIFAPHTSNWDFMTMIMAKFAWGLNVKYLGKHSLFKWPTGWLFRALGGMPVVRHESHNVVSQVVNLIKDQEKILLALSPEGTRGFTPYWKSGFYHIADRAEFPIIMCYLDCTTRTIGLSEVFHLTGNIDDDMEKFAAFYADKEGYNPEQTSIIQTRKKYKQSLSDKSN